MDYFPISISLNSPFKQTNFSKSIKKDLFTIVVIKCRKTKTLKPLMKRNIENFRFWVFFNKLYQYSHN